MSTDLTVPPSEFIVSDGRVFNTNLSYHSNLSPEMEAEEARRLFSGELTWRENKCRIQDGTSTGVVTYVKSDGYGNLTPVLPVGMPAHLKAYAECSVRNQERKTRVVARLRMRLLEKAATA